jgi:hypothetical protein
VRHEKKGATRGRQFDGDQVEAVRGMMNYVHKQ